MKYEFLPCFLGRNSVLGLFYKLDGAFGNPMAIFPTILHFAVWIFTKDPLCPAQNFFAGGRQTFGIQRLADVCERALHKRCILTVKNMNAVSQPNELVHGSPPFFNIGTRRILQPRLATALD
jgi:hypothetical protein